MARAYGQDLHDGIDAALGGMPAWQAAAQFEIGVATAIVWVRRARARRNAPTTSPPQAMIRIKLKML